MGHERIPHLPRTERWKNIVADIALTATNESTTDQIVKKTFDCIEERFRRLHLEQSVQDAFLFLILITIASRSDRPDELLKTNKIDLDTKKASPLNLSKQLDLYMDKFNGSLEYRALAKNAATKAMAEYYRRESGQLGLFAYSKDPFTVWEKASNGSGFSVLSRLYFSALTSDYIKYFLDREASSVLPNLNSRNMFSKGIDEHVDRVTKHSFEVSKIAQSFAAGWYNKNVKDQLPSRSKARGFLSIALNKIRDSLTREGL